MAPADSRLDEFQTQAEHLSDELISAVPTELEPVPGAVESDMRIGDTESGQESPSDPAWWQVQVYVPVKDASGSSDAAAAAMTAHLEAAGWSSKEVRVTDDGARTVDGFRKDSWYIELGHYESAPGKAELVEITIVSPPTVRGDH